VRGTNGWKTVYILNHLLVQNVLMLQHYGFEVKLI